MSAVHISMAQLKSGRGLPQSKTLRVFQGPGTCTTFLDRAFPSGAFGMRGSKLETPH